MMKKLFCLIMMALTSVLLVSCNLLGGPDEEEITLSLYPSETVTLPAEGGEQRIVITTNQEKWRAKSYQSWCHIKADGFDLIIYADPNPSTDPMPTAQVEVEVGKDNNTVSRTLTVNQPGKSAPAENTVIPDSGGTVVKEGLVMEVPTGTFTATVDVQVKKMNSGSTMSQYEASDYYSITLPASFAKPLTVSLNPTTALRGEVFMLVATDARATSYSNVTRGSRLIKATLKDGRYTALLEPSMEKIPLDEKVHLTVGLVKDYISSESIGTRTITEQQKCVVLMPFDYDDYEKCKKEIRELSEFAEYTYKKIESLGYSFEPRSSQILLHVLPLSDEGYGYYTSSKLGINWSNIELNLKKMRDLRNMKQTILHEMIHLVNAIYDPRFYFTKAICKDPFLWMDEAIAVWAEEFFDGGVSQVWLNNCTCPFEGFFPKADESLGEHGYGMSALIKYCAKTYGNTSIVKLAQAWKAGKSSIKACFDTAFPDLFSMENYYTFLTDYLLGEVYPLPSLWKTYGPTPRLTISNDTPYTHNFSQLAPYSLVIARFYLNQDIISTNKKIHIVKAGDGGSAVLYKYAQLTGKAEYIASFDTTYDYTDLKNFKSGDLLCVVVYNLCGTASNAVAITAQLEDIQDDSYCYNIAEVHIQIDRVKSIETYTDGETYVREDAYYRHDYNRADHTQEIPHTQSGTWAKSGANMVYSEEYEWSVNYEENIFFTKETRKGKIELVINPQSNTIISGTLLETVIKDCKDDDDWEDGATYVQAMIYEESATIKDIAFCWKYKNQLCFSSTKDGGYGTPSQHIASFKSLRTEVRSDGTKETVEKTDPRPDADWTITVVFTEK